MAKIKQDSLVDGEQPVVVLDDGTEVNLNELSQGYLRQSDYTKKTQALAADRKAFEEAKGSQQTWQVDNSQSTGNNDYTEMTKMFLDTKMSNMKIKYGDEFNEIEVLQEAQNMLNQGVNPTNLDFEKIHKAIAYSKRNPEDMEAAMREKILAELAASNIDTSSIIGGADGSVGAGNDLGLTRQELEFCARSGEDPATYAKWKNRK